MLYILRKTLGLIAVLVFALISCTSNSNENKNVKDEFNLPYPKDIVLSQGALPGNDDIKRIMIDGEQFYLNLLKPNNFSGGLLIAKNGHIIYEKYAGKEDFNGNQPINENTPLHIASSSKTFTAMAILRLMEYGYLKIEDTVAKYLPDFNYPNVTIKDLLTHRSGLPNYLYFMDGYQWPKDKKCTNEDVYKILVTKKDSLFDIHTPNTKFQYNNTNYAVLALIVEKISKRSFPDFMQEQFFGPLGMRNTYVFRPKDSTTAVPTFFNNGRRYPTNAMEWVYGDKNIYTTPRDLLIWDKALKGNLFKPETLAAAYTGYSNEKPGIRNYGLGWRMNIYENGKKIIFHNGWWHGTNSVFWRLLDEDATIICIGNRYNRAIYDAASLSYLFNSEYGFKHYIEETDSTTSKLNAQKIQTFNRDSAIKVLKEKKILKWEDSLKKMEIQYQDNLKKKVSKFRLRFEDANPR